MLRILKFSTKLFRLISSFIPERKTLSGLKCPGLEKYKESCLKLKLQRGLKSNETWCKHWNIKKDEQIYLFPHSSTGLEQPNFNLY
jgi:hypothetical protein